MTTLTPPVPPTQAPEPGNAGGPGRSVATVITVVGAVVLIGMLVAGMFGAVRAIASPAGTEQSFRADATGATALVLDVSTADVEVRFADVSEARLEVQPRGSDGATWNLRREGDEIKVVQNDGFNWSFGWDFGTEHVTLQLPRGLEGKLDATVDVSAGSVSLAGDYRDVRLGLSAGDVSYDGDADTMRVEISAGSADITAHDVRTVQLEVSAGSIDAEFTGRQPDLTKVDATAGDVSVSLPHGQYAVQQDVTAGDLSIQVPTDPSASARIEASVTAGDVTIDTDD